LRGRQVRAQSAAILVIAATLELANQTRRHKTAPDRPHFND
jgi:sulfate adenylyltransferase subunit 1 (EFTu-like GTPase family)